MPEVDAAQLEGEAMLSDRIAGSCRISVVQIVDDPDSVSLEVIDGDDASRLRLRSPRMTSLRSSAVVAVIIGHSHARPCTEPLASTLLSR
ncbi:MAG: KH domain-containing protein [Collinsella aerofaciens]